MLERVTHIVEPRVMGMSALAAVAALCGRRGDDPNSIVHRAIVLGGDDAAARSERAGIGMFDRLAVPAGVPHAGSRSLHRLLVSRPAVDLLVCWSANALCLAWLADRGLPRAAMLTVHEPSHPALHGTLLGNPLGRLLFERTVVRAAENTSLAFATPALRDAWAGMLPGAPRGSILSLGVDTDRLRASSRAALRASWCVRENESVVIALGEPECVIDGSSFGYHCGVTSVAGAHLMGLVPPAAFDVERGMRFTERHAGAWRLAVDDRPVWELLPGCDAAYWVGGGPASYSDTPLRWAIASGLPIVATDDEPARTLLAEYPRARLVSLQPTRLYTRAMIDVFGHARSVAPPFGPPVTSGIHRWIHEFDSHLLNLHRPARS